MVERNGARIVARLGAEGWEPSEARAGHAVFRREGRLLVLPLGEWVFAIGTAHAIAVAAGWLGAEE